MAKSAVIDKTKGPTKSPGLPITAGKKKSAETKARKMGARAKVKPMAPVVLCAQGHPTQLVHYNYLRNMQRWCPTCLGVV